MDCDKNWILYNNQLSGWMERKLLSTSQRQTCTKKRVMVTVWWSVDSLIHYSSLNPGKSITSVKYAQQINKMHWKLQCLYPALVNRKGQILHNNAQLHVTQIMLQKLIWTMKFGLICHIHLTSPQQTTTSSIISKTFCRENAFTTSRTQKMLSKSSSNPEAWFFVATGTNLFIIGKNVLIVMVPIFITKDVFEFSYNDLKSRVQYFYYFCTNLITPSKIKPERQTLNH